MSHKSRKRKQAVRKLCEEMKTMLQGAIDYVWGKSRPTNQKED